MGVYYFGSGGLKIPHSVPPFGINIDRWAYGGGGGTQNPGVGGAHRAHPPALANSISDDYKSFTVIGSRYNA